MTEMFTCFLRDHPRIRGEHSPLPDFFAEGFGSSPHTRGALSPNVRRHDTRQDHPRIRGEHSKGFPTGVTFSGSSPHTRGAPRHLHLRRQTRRIIPAYAGSTRRRRSPRARLADHPRIRGEHIGERVDGLDLVGSSPHTRGALTSANATIQGFRIIPAYAGSTRASGTASPAPPDHPRIRGEHSAASPSTSSAAGSSPHTRGAPAIRWTSPRSWRIIPAYAGSTNAASCR